MTTKGTTAAVLCILSAVLSSCASIEQTTTSKGFQKEFGESAYCELKAVKQENRDACGLACLESLLDYWELDGTQASMAVVSPPTRSGHSLSKLKSIAEQHGLTAYSVSFDDQPLALLQSELEQGRPTLLAIRCPLGHYFGEPFPVIGHLDSTVVGFSISEERYSGAQILTTRDRKKDHYVVAFGYDESANEILLMDPAYGLVSISANRLKGFWDDQNYAALVCARSVAEPNPTAEVALTQN